MAKIHSKNCEYCGRTYTGVGKYFCSPACRNKARTAIKRPKHSLWMKSNNPMKNPKSAKKCSETLKKRFKQLPHWAKGKTLSPEHKKKISIALKQQWQIPEIKEKRLRHLVQINHSEIDKRHWQDKEWRNRQVEAILKGLMKRPTKPEQKLINIIKKHGLPFTYTGNGSFLIEGFNPDFVCTNPSRKIIEVFGDFHHRLPQRLLRDKQRLRVFSQNGFQTMVIWASELRRLNENEILDKIRRFLIGN
jgi:very-short-patch-repair endonuclease/YHS domain-containing protein